MTRDFTPDDVRRFLELLGTTLFGYLLGTWLTPSSRYAVKSRDFRIYSSTHFCADSHARSASDSAIASQKRRR